MKINFLFGAVLGVITLTLLTYLAVHMLPFIALFVIVFLAIKINKLLSK